MNSPDVEYLIHRLYEHYDSVNCYEVDDCYILRISHYAPEGRQVFTVDINFDFDDKDTASKVEEIVSDFYGRYEETVGQGQL